LYGTTPFKKGGVFYALPQRGRKSAAKKRAKTPCGTQSEGLKGALKTHPNGKVGNPGKFPFKKGQ